MQPKKKTKKAYLNIIRAIAVGIILVHHFWTSCVEYSVTGFTFVHANGDFGQIGVNLFWLLSGAVMILNYQEHFDIRHYYKRRILSILPLYWLTWLAFYTYFMITSGWLPIWKLDPVRLLLTVLGVDGYISSVTWTYFLVGEWFTGV